MQRPSISPLALDAPPASLRDETDYAQRDFLNLVSAVFLLCIALLITWTVAAVAENEKRQRCFESGRRDCVVIAAPPHGLRVPTY